MSHSHLTPKLSHSEVISHLKAILNPEDVVTDPSELKAIGTDWTKVFEPNPLCAVYPRSTEQVSKILKFCHTNEIAVTPSGGRTGLCAGAVASKGEVVVSLSKMNRILDVDKVGLTITCEAGVTTEALQMAAKDCGLFFPLDLAAKGSCQIGGNIATNAGGVKLIRYGGTREQVLGIEVVLANGDVLDMNVGLRKNNSGYDLKQLFIGSEGTLGIVTKAVLRLTAKPRSLNLAIMATDSFVKVPKILEVANQRSVVLTAFEFFTDVAHRIVLSKLPGARTPFAEMAKFYVLLEVEETGDGSDLEGLLEVLLEKELIHDATLAANSTQFREFWGLRENITESLAAHGHVRKNDISLSIDRLNDFVSELELFISKSQPSSMEIVLFGHIGDGNLHINYVSPKTEDFKAFNDRARNVEEGVFKLLAKHKGSISAEHGIGLTKKKDLHFTRTREEVLWMKQIKAQFDPKGILNPGKIFDLDQVR